MRIAALLAVALAACHPGQKQRPVATPDVPRPPVELPVLHPAGAPVFPDPPAQERPWTPPRSGLGARWTSVTEAVFAAGLADPRECEYRAVGLQVGSVWGGASVVETHAWVLPDGGGERFAVAWNGLVYPVRSVGAAADVAADVELAIAADERMRAAHAADHPDSTFYRFRNAMPEATGVAADSLLPIRIALLLRLGRGDLAERAWRAWSTGMRRRTNDDDVHLDDPYLMLAGDWIWALFDRAVCAHIRGDDRIALESVRQLAVVRDRVELEAQRREFPRREACGHGECVEQPYLDFLEPLPALLADQERRAAGAGAVPVSVEELRELPPRERVAVLMARLDEVRARQWGQPGGVDLATDPTVAALIDLGDVAVEPLIAALRDDSRLTRSVHFHRDFHRHRSLLGAHEAAYAALASILQTDFFAPQATGDDLSGRGAEGRARAAKAIEAYWTELGALPVHERWFRVLADDRAGAEGWLQAAANIVQPDDVVRRGNTTFIPARAPGKVIVPRGEPLRAKAAPSVSELMARRVRDVAATPNAGHRAACALAQHFTEWDPVAAVATLRDETAGSIELWKRASGSERASVAACIGRHVLARAAAGDEDALDQYARWVVNVSPEFTLVVEHVFAPLWVHRASPKLRAATDALFARDGSAWLPLILPEGGHGLDTDVLQSPLRELPTLRKRIRHELGLRHRVGTFRVRRQGEIEIEGDAGWQMYSSREDAHVPRPGTKGTVRYCDLLALELARLRDDFDFEVHWSQSARDAAITRLVRRL